MFEVNRHFSTVFEDFEKKSENFGENKKIGKVKSAEENFGPCPLI